MALQGPSAEDGSLSGVARLTAKERECLDRWLDHATAKEIALDLGVSHHAVEKRLKSARQKLGVATTLDAARLLAAADGYGRTASRPSEVVAGPDLSDTASVVAVPPETSGWWRRSRWMIAGVTIMSLFLLSALLLSAAGAGDVALSQNRVAAPDVALVDMRAGRAEDLDAALARTFARLDKNASGYLEGSELKGSLIRVSRKTGDTSLVSQDRSVGLTDLDADKNGRVSQAEHRAGMTSLLAQAGRALEAAD